MKLVKILSDKVQIRSDYKEFDDVRINDLIAVSDGEVELVTMVNTLTDIDTENEEEIGENDYILEHSSTKMLECSIIGTVKDGTFQKAIDKYPTMKVSAHRISKEEFASMLSRYTEGFCIGEYSAYEFPAYVDGNKFFPETCLYCWKHRRRKIRDSGENFGADKQITWGECDRI